MNVLRVNIHADHLRGGLFFFNDTATTEIYTLSLHDALPISGPAAERAAHVLNALGMECEAVGDEIGQACAVKMIRSIIVRSEEHTSELQSRQYLVCRLLLEKKKNISRPHLDYATTSNLHHHT